MTSMVTMENVHAGLLWSGHTGNGMETGVLAMAYPLMRVLISLLTTCYPMQ